MAGVLISLGVSLVINKGKLINPGEIFVAKPRPKPLLAYTYENLRNRKLAPSAIIFEKLLDPKKSDRVWQVSYKSDGQRVSGVVNLPSLVSSESAWLKPVILMIHGSASVEEYYPGFGTQYLAEFLAKNGYVTIAPDLLGYATSDSPSKNAFENRFQTYTTVLSLISSVCNSRFTVVKVHGNTSATVNSEPGSIANCLIGLWGHSNGGQIALSALEISGISVPTVLWNPVSKPFPYNILFYTDSFEDQGKYLRKALADFEVDYDVEKYSLTNYYDWIKSPILLQQGSSDPWVPKAWSDKLNEELTKKNKKVDYKVYLGNDHNMLPNWNQPASDALGFFKKSL